MLRLQEKLKKIRDGQYKPGDFILADAKDGDMGSGVTCTGQMWDNGVLRRRSRQEFLDKIEEIIKHDVVDIMLLSSSNLELLQDRDAFAGTRVKPAIRANDATDCWGGVRHGQYISHGSRPFSTVHIPRVMHGGIEPDANATVTGTDLGLYSLTFLNDLEADMAAMEAFSEFRLDAARNGFTYFFEVFNPNIDCGLDKTQTGEFVNDSILRSLAGVNRADRPEFLKIPFNGPAAMEELAGFDSEIVVGVLGGSAGTTRDTFELLAQSERYGARVALFGRKINNAESQIDIIELMRLVADSEIGTKEAVAEYHSRLKKLGVPPTRAFEDDSEITEQVLLKGAET